MGKQIAVAENALTNIKHLQPGAAAELERVNPCGGYPISKNSNIAVSGSAWITADQLPDNLKPIGVAVIGESTFRQKFYMFWLIYHKLLA